MTGPALSAESLHDATLLRVDISWIDRRADLTLRLHGDRAALLTGFGITRVSTTLESPWGPSNSVNEVHWSHADQSDSTGVEVEMQSGDVIAVVAAKFILQEVRGDG